MKPTLLASAVLALAGAVTAQSTETFSTNANPAGWSFGPDVIVATGGNPGGWLNAPAVDTFAPILANDPNVDSKFNGDFRALGVTAISLDAITNSADFGAGGRELSIVLRDTKGTPGFDDDDYAYFVGPEVPQIGEGWQSYSYAIPSQSTAAVPAGWSGGWSGDGENFRPGVEWSDVITSVDRVEIWWLHPAFFAIFQNWNVGADNLRIEFGDRWTAVGPALAGSTGEPQLTGFGSLGAGAETEITLSGGLPGAMAWFVASTAQLNAPFKGGVMVPGVDLLIPRPLNAAGARALRFDWPAGVPSGTTLVVQGWIQDAGGPAGFAASNGLVGTAP